MSSGLLSVKAPFWGAGFGAKLEGGGSGGGEWVGFRDEASGFRAAALPKTKRCRNHREGHRNGSGKAHCWKTNLPRSHPEGSSYYRKSPL